jgi:hypothetical protein
MKSKNIITLCLLILLGTKASAQEIVTSTTITTTTGTKPTGGEKYGRTLNLALGIGYYGYIGSTAPVMHLDFEFDVAKNLTLAPFITYYSYNNYYYWGNAHYPYRDYSYRTTVIPVGVKGTYYFDQLLGAGPRWDFYLAGSIGFAIRKTTWENGYYGETVVQHGSSGLYLDGHIGAEYHLNRKLGLFLDLSSGISTFGLGIHL